MNKFLVNVRLWRAGDATIVQLMYKTENSFSQAVFTVKGEQYIIEALTQEGLI